MDHQRRSCSYLGSFLAVLILLLLVGIGLTAWLWPNSASASSAQPLPLPSLSSSHPNSHDNNILADTPALSPTPICVPEWSVVTSYDPPDSVVNRLGGVAFVSPNDIWAVGYHSLVTGNATLVERWDGGERQWKGVTSPNPTINPDVGLVGVAVISSTDVWAVGTDFSSGPARTLTEHWDGNRWSMIPSPNIGDTHDNQLFKVSGVSANDVWAAGYYSGGVDNSPQTLIEHWDGTQWSIAPSPNPGSQHNSLASVTAISRNDVWAVGNQANRGSRMQTLALHWNGQEWSVVPTPNRQGDNALYGVSAVSTNDVWVVGQGGGLLTEHWDGSQWSIIDSPNPVIDSSFFDINALSTNDAWAVGYSPAPGRNLTLIEHWDGLQWTIVPSPSPGLIDNNLEAVVALSPTDVWAVGYQWNGSRTPWRTLVEHFSYPDSCAPPPTHTPIPTATATATATPTPASCTMGFTDVQPSDYFYQAVRYLYCDGVISGYSDGTFRPFGNITRGQICKVVVLANGLPIDDEGGPHFSDVPTDHAFYPYIETAFNRGIISGYPDGTFRPDNNVTRGQLSKVVTLAEGWEIDVTGGPHFSDVPPVHPFYLYIETVQHHGVLGGYDDGTFRAYNNATRGQVCATIYASLP